MSLGKGARWLLPLIVIIIGVAASVLLIVSKPPPQKQDKAAAGVVVETVTVREAEHSVLVRGQGSVQAAKEIIVTPQVAGEIVEINRQLVAGSVVRAGELLFRIDPRDYQVALQQQEASVREAQAALSLEQGQREVAEQEWELFADELREDQRNPALALREPQLQQAQAALASAQAALEKAQLDLTRTRVSAPFDAVIAEESIDLGQNVSSQTQALRLIGIDTLRVQTAIPVAQLPYITVDAERGSRADVNFDLGDRQLRYQGRVVQLLPELADSSRMARVLVEIPQPFAGAPTQLSITQRSDESPANHDQQGLQPKQIPLLINSYVSVDIHGEQTLQAVELPRDYLRQGDQVWVMDDNNTLAIREVTIAWQRPNTVLVTEGLADGDAVVSSNIASPIEGLALRREETSPATESERAKEQQAQQHKNSAERAPQSKSEP